MLLLKDKKGEEGGGMSYGTLVGIVISVIVLIIILIFVAFQKGYFSSVLPSLPNSFR